MMLGGMMGHLWVVGSPGMVRVGLVMWCAWVVGSQLVEWCFEVVIPTLRGILPALLTFAGSQWWQQQVRS